ncbi:MAG: hypothetical protein OEL66_00265, partial [Desulfobulbaceae bacterium]|nr:hypothetical protein [Desulfobulbaceae bacterium]
MASRDDISATEKLLDIIRTETPVAEASSPETAKAGSPVEDDSASEGGGATLAPDVSEGAVDAASSPVNANNGYF